MLNLALLDPEVDRDDEDPAALVAPWEYSCREIKGRKVGQRVYSLQEPPGEKV